MVADHKLVFILMGFDGWWNRWDLSVCHTIVGDVTIVRIFRLMIDNSCNSFGDILLLRLALVHGAWQWFSFTIGLNLILVIFEREP